MLLIYWQKLPKFLELASLSSWLTIENSLSVRLFFCDVQGQVFPGQLLQRWDDHGLQLIAITQDEIFVCVCFITGLYSDDVEPYEREILGNFGDA